MVVMSQSMSGKLKSSPIQNVAFLCAAMSVLMVSCMYLAMVMSLLGGRYTDTNTIVGWLCGVTLYSGYFGSNTFTVHNRDVRCSVSTGFV